MIIFTVEINIKDTVPWTCESLPVITLWSWCRARAALATCTSALMEAYPPHIMKTSMTFNYFIFLFKVSNNSTKKYVLFSTTMDNCFCLIKEN